MIPPVDAPPAVEAENVGRRNGHSRCLLCGHLNPMSLKLSFQSGDNGVVRTCFQSSPVLQGYEDILHGGVMASLLDAAMTHCLFHKGIRAVTGDLRVRYMQPVSCRALLDIQAWLLTSRPPLYRLRGEITHGGHVVAWAEAKFMQTQPSG